MLKLTKERLKRRWTKAELARRSCLDQALISKFESGRLRPYDRELRRLARALGQASAGATSLLDDDPEETSVVSTLGRNQPGAGRSRQAIELLPVGEPKQR